MRKFQVILLVLIAVGLEACGFRLRGQLPLAEQINVIYIDASAGNFAEADNFRDMLADSIEGTGATVVADPGSAKAVLQISQFTYERVVRTLDARGKVNGYTLVYTINYDVLDATGDIITAGRSLQELADFDFNPAEILQEEQEEEAIRENMEEELVLRILRQLSTLG